VKDLLQTALAGRGFSATTSAEKLAGYLAIENTYLSTFQALGGLGLVLGSLGLAVVLLRSVWERQGELALLQALGYRHGSLNRLILIENATLLGLGLVVGAAAALLSVAPQLVAGTATLPWGRLSFLLGLVVVVGLTATVLATWAALRQPLQPALRRE
jgi:ABC-type antimicrobial peptide transport system permease subunit